MTSEQTTDSSVVASQLNRVDIDAIVGGTHTDPFSVLGPHQLGSHWYLRAFFPGVQSIEVVIPDTHSVLFALEPVSGTDGMFEGVWPVASKGDLADPSGISYQWRLTKTTSENESEESHVWTIEDPYRFGPILGEIDEYLISEGSHMRLWQALGAHVLVHEGVSGVHFATWAPNARRVSVIGDFNQWDGRCHCMRRRGQTGIWEIFVPGLVDGEAYKFELLDAKGRLLPQKADPVGFGAEHAPNTASVVRELKAYPWSDDQWMSAREVSNRVDQPMLIYEVQLGSWKRKLDIQERALSYDELATELVMYAQNLGFTHLELMPISEFPFDGSWGYQPIGLFAPTIRHGTLNEFRAFVNACHRANMGLILDWVPGHFPEDQHGLGRFDGSPLYEHADRREGFHPDWNTLVYNYGRREVANFLISNALYWFEEHHIDGIRVDAVASMLYRDYSRKDGEWIPNKDGGRENLEAIDFLQRVNEVCYAQHAGIATIAEESTAFPGVTGMTSSGGLGFGYKWNMGWMNDSLQYMQEDPINRKYHHTNMTFGLHYAYSENFVLPLSHDEVVHGKGSLLTKMPGSREDQFANLRAYYGFMWGHPGKKLLFMGGEIAQINEWNHLQSIDWHLLDDPMHKGMQTLIHDLNFLLRSTPALYQLDNKPEGFVWLEEHAADESLMAWLRRGIDDKRQVLVVCNFTPVLRSERRIGVPAAGRWVERVNTDAAHYGGSGQGNMGAVMSEPVACAGHAQSLRLTLPPLSTLFLEHEQ